MTAPKFPGEVVSEMTASDIDRIAGLLRGDPDVVVESGVDSSGNSEVVVQSEARGVAVFFRTTDGEQEIVGWGPEPTIYRFPGPEMSGHAQAVSDGVATLWERLTAVFPTALS